MNKLLAKDSRVAAGMKVCRKVCWTYYQYSIELKCDPNFLGSPSKPIEEDGLNQSLEAIGESPLKVSKYSYDQRPSYLKAKQLKAAEAIKRKFNEIEDHVACQTEAASAEIKDKASDLDRLVELMKSKIAESPYHQQIKILTLAPTSWSQQKTAEYFQVCQLFEFTFFDLKYCPRFAYSVCPFCWGDKLLNTIQLFQELVKCEITQLWLGKCLTHRMILENIQK